LAGLLAAELAVGHNSPQLNAALRADSPTRLPPKPLAYLGANAFMRYQEYNAGKEL